MFWTIFIFLMLLAWRTDQERAQVSLECKQLIKEISDLAGKRGNERACRTWVKSRTVWSARKNLMALSRQVDDEMRAEDKVNYTLKGRVRNLTLVPNPRRTSGGLVPLGGGHAHFSLEIEGGYYLASTTDKWAVEALEHIEEGENVTVCGITKFKIYGPLNLGRIPVTQDTVRGTIEVENIEINGN